MSSEAGPAAQVIVVTRDLMDRSKITAAFPNARVVARLDALRGLEQLPLLAVVDLRLVDDPADLGSLAERVVAFGSHVDDQVLAAAADGGAEAMPRSVFFRRLGDGTIGAATD